MRWRLRCVHNQTQNGRFMAFHPKAWGTYWTRTRVSAGSRSKARDNSARLPRPKRSGSRWTTTPLSASSGAVLGGAQTCTASPAATKAPATNRV